MANIYTDTNALRYLGVAFADMSLQEDLQPHLLMSPLVLVELLSQLGTNGADEAFSTVQAFLRIHNAKATGMLPWVNDFFRCNLFNLPPNEDKIMPALKNAVTNVLNATSPEELRTDGEQLRAWFDAARNENATNFSALLTNWRGNGPLSETEHQAIFARSIARRANVDESQVNVDAIMTSLDALYVFEKTKLEVASQHTNYNVEAHSNDLYDAELLVYLADPSLHLLTADRGFRRVCGSAQANKVHIVEQACLTDPHCATEVIREISSL